jgi:hypothetical protein
MTRNKPGGDEALVNLGEIVAAHARLQPQKIGARDSRRALTFAQWNARACRLANALLALASQQGDRVALLAYNRVEWMEIYIALAKAGLIAVPINFRLVTPEIRYIVEHLRGESADRAGRARVPCRASARHVADPSCQWIHIGDSTPPAWSGYESLIEGAVGREPGIRRQARRPMGVHVHVRDDRQAQGSDPQPRRAGGDFARHRARHGTLQRGHGVARDADVPCELSLLRIHVRPTSARPSSSTTAAFRSETLLSTIAAQHITFTSLVPTHFIMGARLAGRGQGALRRAPHPQADDLLRADAQGHEARDPRLFQELAALRALRLDRGGLGHAVAP